MMNKRWMAWHAKSRLLVFLVFVILCGVLIWASPSFAVNQSNAVQVQSLQGKWEFYWNQLLTPADFASTDSAVQQHLAQTKADIQVPGSWQGQVLGASVNGGEPLPQSGYATYRKVLHFSSEQIGQHIGIHFRYLDAASRIWINGNLVGELGKVATSAAEEIPKLQMYLVTFEPKTKDVEVVIQVSNHSFRESGIVGEVLLGNDRDLVEYVFKYEVVGDLLFIGVFLVLAIYHFTIYWVRRLERAYLWVGFVSLSAGIRTFTLSEYMVSMFFPDLPWTMIIRLEYVMEMLIAAFFALLIHAMYPNLANPRGWKITWVVSSAWILFLLIGPIQTVTSALLIHALIILSVFIYYIFVVGIKVFTQKETGSILHLTGLAVMSIGILNEIAYYILGWETTPMIGYCILAYFLIQAILISYRYSLVMEKNRVLSQQLLVINNELEQIVIQRTQELHVQNEELTQLHQQRSNLMENIAHDLGSPLSGIQLHIQVIEEETPVNDPNKSIFKQLLAQFEYMKNLVNDLFVLSRLESKQETFHFERITIQQLWGGIYAVLMEKETLDGLHVQVERLEMKDITTGDAPSVLVDQNHLHRVIRNYADNAIKYRRDTSDRVDVCFYLERNYQLAWTVVFEMTDYGIGISEAELPHVFGRFYKANHHQKGSGLGLSIVKEIVEQHQGVVSVRSVEGMGSTFGFTIPIQE